MQTRNTRPPGPKPWPLVGSLPLVLKNPIDFFRHMTLDYGVMSYARLGPLEYYSINSPELIEELLHTRGAACIKDSTTRALRPLVGDGLLTSEGELWKRQRKLAAKPFTPKQLDSYETVMVECATRMFASLRDGETRDFHRDSLSLTLEIAGRTLVGTQTARELQQVGDAVEAALAYFHERMRTWGALLPPGFPTPKLLRFRRAKVELDRVVKAIMARCRRDGADADHLLARLLHATSEGGQAMPDHLVLDEVITALAAGHETTALALVFALYLLSEHPTEAATLRAEIDAELAGRSIAVRDLERLRYLDAVIRETLRLYPPAYAIGREVVEPFELGGYVLPRGAQILVSPYGMQRSASFYREPERFRPERWLNGETTQLPRYAYLPFGGGQRICIGNHFALRELSLVLATAVQQVELSVVPGFKLVLDPTVTLRSKHGLPVRIKRRTDLRAQQQSLGAAPP